MSVDVNVNDDDSSHIFSLQCKARETEKKTQREINQMGITQGHCHSLQSEGLLLALDEHRLSDVLHEHHLTTS